MPDVMTFTRWMLAKKSLFKMDHKGQKYDTLSESSKNKNCFRYMNNRAVGNDAYEPTEIEHVANVVTHGVWIIPSFFGLKILLQHAQSTHQYFSCLIYGLATLSLFVISTLFHCVFYSGKFKFLKVILHRCDRAIIYIFIAASYFPWLRLKKMDPSSFGSELYWISWFLAGLGILYQHLFHERYKMVETICYLIAGLFPSLAIFYMRDSKGLTELSLGGAIYIVGMIFFKSDGRIPFAHAIWHMFVNAGATLHFYAVWKYLIVSDDVSDL